MKNNIRYAHNHIRSFFEELNDVSLYNTSEYFEIESNNKFTDKNTRVYSIASSMTPPNHVIEKFLESVQDDMNPAFAMSSSHNRLLKNIMYIQSTLKDPFISQNIKQNRIQLYRSTEKLGTNSFTVMRPYTNDYNWSIPRNKSKEEYNYIRYKNSSTDEELFKLPMKDEDGETYELSKEKYPYTLEYDNNEEIHILETPKDTYYYDERKNISSDFIPVNRPIHSYLYDKEKYHNYVDNIEFFVIDSNNGNIYNTSIQNLQKIN